MVSLDGATKVVSDYVDRSRNVNATFVPADGNRNKFFQVGEVGAPKRLILQDFLLSGVNRVDATFVEIQVQWEDKDSVWKNLVTMRLDGLDCKMIGHSFTGKVDTARMADDAPLRFQMINTDSTDYEFNIVAIGREE